MYIQAKKRFGQHFLKDKHIAQRICEALNDFGKNEQDNYGVLEIGPGQGVLTQFLYPEYGEHLHLVEIDRDLIPALKTNYPIIANQIHEQDFLEMDLSPVCDGSLGVIGNFPYNISSQILFKLVENYVKIPILVGMFQKEVAQRVASKPGNKVYGLISAWVQSFYDTEILFTVNEGSFSPPPTVKSAVIRLIRKETAPDCDHKLLLQVIKAAFNQRRKTLRNALDLYKNRFDKIEDPSILTKRAETLSYEDFIGLAKAFHM